MATTLPAAKRPRRQAQPPVAVQFLHTLATIHASLQVTTREGRTLVLSEGLARGIATIKACAQAGCKLIFIGNGGSAGIASHQAVDYWKNGGLEAVAFNDASLLTCISNDFGYERVFAEPINRFGKPGDLLVAISSSGKSPNILQGVEAARARQCRIVTLSGFGATNPLRALGDLNFYVPSPAYGIVEVTHLALLHAMLDETIARRKMPREC